MKKQLFILMTILGLLLIPIIVSAQSELTSDDIARISQSIVLIEARANGEALGTGSGTIVSSDGLIYTNRHVVEGADEYAIYVLDDPNERPVLSYFAELELVFPYTPYADNEDVYLDFAVLQINRDANGNALLRTNIDLPAISMSKFRPRERGDRVFVFGYPGLGGGYLVFTEGIITTVRNNDVAGDRIPVWYQTGAEISPGNSGGLVVDANGIPVGIPTTVISSTTAATSLGGILPLDFVQAAINGGIPPVPLAEFHAGSTAPTGGGDGEVSIEITDIEFDIDVDGESSAVIYTTITADGYQDQPIQALVFFIWGNPQDEEFLAMESSRDDFANNSGFLFVSETLTPSFDSSIWEDFTFIVPMDAFPEVTAAEEAYAIGVISTGGEEFDAFSNTSEFELTPASRPISREGIDIACPNDGPVIEDGVEIIVVGMRPNFDYKATVIGIDDFDPILAVTSEDISTGQAELCNDDSEDADGYAVNLPSSGRVNGSEFSSQVIFSHSNDDTLNVTLIVGEFEARTGEFIIILEGMASTSADGRGDPFVLDVTPNVAASPVPISLYMIGAEPQLNPLFYILNIDANEPLEDGSGNPYLCDNAATSSCYRNSESLVGSSVRIDGGRTIQADENDAMMSLPIQTETDSSITIPLIMTSSRQQSTGQYVLIMHIGVEGN